jgi:hypothetical protein
MLDGRASQHTGARRVPLTGHGARCGPIIAAVPGAGATHGDSSQGRGERLAQPGRIRPYLAWQPQERGPRRLEANSHRSAPRAVQIAQRRLARRRSWYEPGCRHRPQGGPAEMPVSEHARRARSGFPTQLSATSGQEPLSGGAVLIGGEGTYQLDCGALDEAEDDVDGGPRSARHSEATAGRASSIVGDRCDGTVRRALRGTAQVPDLRGARRVSLRRGGCQFARRSTR